MQKYWKCSPSSPNRRVSRPQPITIFSMLALIPKTGNTSPKCIGTEWPTKGTLATDTTSHRIPKGTQPISRPKNAWTQEKQISVTA